MTYLLIAIAVWIFVNFGFFCAVKIKHYRVGRRHDIFQVFSEMIPNSMGATVAIVSMTICLYANTIL